MDTHREPAEHMRVRGRVEALEGEGAPVVLRATRAVEGGATDHAARGARFRLRLASGAALVIEVPDAREVRCVPVEALRGRWSKLAAHPLAAAFGGGAPAAGARVALELFALREGDAVAVYGAVSARAFDEHAAGPRSAPEARIGALRAEVVAAGPAPDRALDEALAELHLPHARASPARDARERWLRGIALAALALAVAALVLASQLAASGPRLEALTSAFGMIAAFVYAAGAVDVPHLAAKQARGFGQDDPVRTRVVVAAITLCGVGAFGFTAVYTDLHRVGETGARTLSALVGAVLVLPLGAQLFAGFASRRWIALLLRAPALPPDPAVGAWGCVVGVVRDPTPVRVEQGEVALARDQDITVVPGSDPNIVHTTLHNREGFLVEARDAIFEVRPAEAVWGSAVVDTQRTPSGRRVRELVPLGAGVVVVGHAHRPAPGGAIELQAAQGRPLVFFASAPGDDPLRALRRGRTRGRVVSALLVALAATIAVVTAASSPALPPEHVHSD